MSKERDINYIMDIDEFRENVLSHMTPLKEEWAVKFKSLLSRSGYSKTKFAELCATSRVSVDKWCKGSIPKNRETLINIGQVAGCDRNEVNELLLHFGRFPGLDASGYESFRGFYDYVITAIQANYLTPGYGKSIRDMAGIQGWSSSMTQSVYNIGQNKWYPVRDKVISLAIHLSLDHIETDEMLSLAHMEPLSDRNMFECAIIYILENAGQSGILDRNDRFYNPDGLCRYARRVLSGLDIPETKKFMSELPDF